MVTELALPGPLEIAPGIIIVNSDPTLPPRVAARTRLLGVGLTLSVFTPFASPHPPWRGIGDVCVLHFRNVEETVGLSDVIASAIFGSH